MAKITYDRLFDFSNPADLQQAIKNIGELNTIYDRLISDVTKNRGKFSGAIQEIQKSTQTAVQSQQAFTIATEKGRTASLEASKATEAQFQAFNALNTSIKQTDVTLNKLTKEQTEFNAKAKETIKLQTELQKLEAKSTSLNSEEAASIAKVRLEIQQKNAALKQSAKESLGLVTIYDKEVQKLTQLQKNYKAVAIQYGENSRQAKKLHAELAILDSRIKRIDANAGIHTKSVGHYSTAFNGAANSARQLAMALGFTGVIFALVGAFRAAFGIIRDFQKENAILAGVLGKSRKEIGALTADAERLGAITAKTATEVTKLQIEYARLGFTENEVLSLTEDTIQGSIALNAELDRTAALVGAIVRTYDDLEATDGGQIVDQLTLAANRSALSFEKLETAIPIVSGAANAAKVPFNEVLAVLGKLSDAGIDASTSATAFRNILLEAAAQGRDYKDLIDDVRNSTDKLTLSYDYFGKRGAVQAVVLAGVTEETRKLSEELRDDFAGNAARAANEQLNTLAGSSELAKSAIEGLVLSLDNGTGRLSAFSKAFVDAFTQSVSLVTAWNEGLITTSKLIGTITNPANAPAVQLEIASKNAIAAFEKQQKAAITATEIQRLYQMAVDNSVKSWEDFQKLEPSRLIDKTADSEAVLLGIQNKFTQSLVKQAEQIKKTGAISISELEDELKLLRERFDLASDFESRERIGAQIKSKQEQIKLLEEEGKGIQTNAEIADEFYEKYIAGTIKAKEATGDLATEIEVKLPDAIDEVESSTESTMSKLQALFGRLGDWWEQWGEEVQAAIQGVSNVVNQFAQNQSIRRENAFAKFEEQQEAEITKLEERRDRELAIENLTAQQKEAINRKYDQSILKLDNETDARRRRLRIKEARAQKLQAVFSATINTAVAATAALPNLILSGIIAALGAAQVAAIAAQPIPQYFKGTPVTGHPGGPAYVGERGREMMFTPDGQVSFTPNRKTLVDLPEGSHVLTNAITRRILENGPEKELIAGSKLSNPQQIEQIVKVIKDEKETEYLVEQFTHALKKMPFQYVNFGDKGEMVSKMQTGMKIRDKIRQRNQY